MTGRTEFIPGLEGLRGVAALSVVAFQAAGSVLDIYATAMAPVVAFFVLSGFVLSQALDRDRSVLTFLRHRAFRLLPAAIFVVLLMTALYLLFGFRVGQLANFDPLNVALNALLLKSDINPPMGSLTVQVAAIPLILACYWLFRAAGYFPLANLVVVLFVLSFSGDYTSWLGGATNLAPLYAFVAGMIAYFRWARREKEPRFSQAIELVALAILLLAACRKQTGYTILAEAISAAALLVAIASTRAPTLLGRLLELDAVRFLGRISYSFYLLHVLGLALAVRVMPSMNPWAYAISMFVVATAATIPMAWLMWRFIEVPFVEMGSRRSRESAACSATPLP